MRGLVMSLAESVVEIMKNAIKKAQFRGITDLN